MDRHRVPGSLPPIAHSLLAWHVAIIAQLAYLDEVVVPPALCYSRDAD